MKKHQTTIMDLAKELGLSKSTVSRALQDHPDISAETKKKVKKLAQETGYSPNMMALNFKKNRNNMIGIIVPDIERPFYASLISGIQQRANSQNFFVLICQSKDSYVTELNIVETLLGLRVSGILLCHSKETVQFPHIEKIIKREVPLLLLDRTPDKYEVHKVVTDHFVGGFMAGEHLAKQGYKKIAIIGGPATLSMSNLRIEGCKAGLKSAGLEIPDKFVKYCNFQRERVLSAASDLLNSKTPPDAFFCVHDRAAIELIKLFDHKGIKIPQEIGIMGFGDEPISNYIEPGLTTIAQHPFKIGELAAETIIHEIMSENAVEMNEQVMNPELIVRKSTMKE